MKISIRQLFVFIFLITAGLPLLAQNARKVVTGRVTDEKHKPLAAFSVYEQSHQENGTVTDNYGKFTLKLINPEDSIIISGLNFITKTVFSNTLSMLNITLVEDAKGLSDVVVTGYGQKQKAITVTGSISSISGDLIRQSPTASLQNALAGRLPGLFSEQQSGQPGNDAAQLQIRGVSTYNSPSTQTPLLLIDDIQSSYSVLSQLDPYQVQSVTILKDASTTAIYGVRGANGVILVTTIRGQAGRPTLSLTGQTGLQAPTNLPKLNSAYTTLQLLKEYELEQGVNPATAYPLFFSGNNMEYYKNNSDPYGHPYVDWWSALMKKFSSQTTVNFDVTGGSKLIRYAISLAYITQGGIYKDFTKDQGYNGNYFMNRYNYRSNIDITPTKTLKIRADLAGIFKITNSPNDAPWNGGASTFQYLWNQQLSGFGYPEYNPNGTFGNPVGIGPSTATTKPNPAANLTYSGYNRVFDNNFSSVVSATQELDFITKGLSVNALASFNSDFLFQKSLTRSYTQILTYYYNPVNSSYTPATPGLYRMGPLSRTYTPEGTSQATTLQASLNYSRSFGDHQITALALYQRLSQTNNTYASSVVTPGVPGNTVSAPIQLTYNYKQKYLLQANATYSGSDRFGNGNQFGLFPAVSAGWNIAEEPFFNKIVKFINVLKFRGSYGITGSDNVGSYKYLYTQTYNNTSYPYYFGATSTSYPGITEGTLGNPNVTWEKDRKTDVGVDLKMFDGALAITADYFHDYRYDILSARLSAPAVIGVGLPILNLGKVDNSGYEIEAKYNGRAKKLAYFLDVQASYAKNKIIFEDEPNKPYPWMQATGHSIGGQFGYVWTGQYYQSIYQILNTPALTTGVPLSTIPLGGLVMKDLNGDGVISQNDVAYLGTNQPQLTAGFSFGLNYKGFDFSMLFNGSFNYIVNIQRGLTNYSERATYASIPYVLGRWTPENSSSASYPALYGGVTTTGSATATAATPSSSFWYHNGGYVRLKNVEFGYMLPSATAKKMHVKSMRFFLNGYNLWLIYNELHAPIDPESVFSSSAGEYPQQKVFNGGLTIGL